jgi:hypothetical protein
MSDPELEVLMQELCGKVLYTCACRDLGPGFAALRSNQLRR